MEFERYYSDSECSEAPFMGHNWEEEQIREFDAFMEKLDRATGNHLEAQSSHGSKRKRATHKAKTGKQNLRFLLQWEGV